jgi:hypothetical protein
MLYHDLKNSEITIKIIYFTPDVTGGTIDQQEYFLYYFICPSPRATGGDRTHDLSDTRHTFKTRGYKMCKRKFMATLGHLG